jgi:hypothetical protein
MKVSILYTMIVISLFSLQQNAKTQDITAEEKCHEQLTKSYIPYNRDYSIFLSPEKKGFFNVTFIGFNTYRIVVCSELDEQFQIKMYDKNDNVLYTSEPFEKSLYWDFQFHSTMSCIIEISPVSKLKNEGYVTFYVGFKNIING